MSGTRWGKGAGEGSFAAAKLPPGPHGLPRELVRDNQRRRILLAALDVFAERGFAAATVKDLIGAAHVSRATFYESFTDKEACMAALHDEILAWLWEEVADAASGTAGWSAQVRVVVGRTVQLLAGDPRLMAVCAPGAIAEVPRARARQERMVERLCTALRAGRGESARGHELPEILERALVYGAIYLLGRSLLYGTGPDPETLSEELPRLLTLPYLD